MENIHFKIDIGCSILYLTKEYEWLCHVLLLAREKVDLIVKTEFSS